MTIFDLDGNEIKSHRLKQEERMEGPPRPEDAALATEKIIAIYLRHNLGKYCSCEGCDNVRERIAPVHPRGR